MSISRLGTVALGAGLILFGLPAVVAPRFFARQVGIPITDHPADAVAIHSVALRDIAFGVGLILAARDGVQLRRWILIRCFCELSDCLGISIAFIRGGGTPRLGALGLFAGLSAVFEAVLYWLAGKPSVVPIEPIKYSVFPRLLRWSDPDRESVPLR